MNRYESRHEPSHILRFTKSLMQRGAARPLTAIFIVMFSVGLACGQEPKVEIPGTKVDVISTTPLAGVDLSRDQIAAPTQVATKDDIEKSGALDLSEFLNLRL